MFVKIVIIFFLTNKRFMNFSSNIKENRIKNVYKFILEIRGGQFENYQVARQFSDAKFRLAQMKLLKYL